MPTAAGNSSRDSACGGDSRDYTAAAWAAAVVGVGTAGTVGAGVAGIAGGSGNSGDINAISGRGSSRATCSLFLVPLPLLQSFLFYSLFIV